LHNLALLRIKKRQFFAIFFGENISKIITSVPVWPEFEKKPKSGQFIVRKDVLLWVSDSIT
jgi:hypothetical protein